MDAQAKVLSLEEVEAALRTDLAEIRERDERKERIEAMIFFVCFFVGGMLVLLKVLLDFAPLVWAFPSCRVIFFRLMGRF